MAAGILSANVQMAAETATAAARFLEQASWGPTPASVSEVQKIGFEKWIANQMDPNLTPLSSFPPVAVDAKGNTSLRPDQDAFFANAVAAPDQLRQRVAFALAQIWVVSDVKLKPEAIPPYLRLLQADAFTTYDKIMYDVTLSPAMGHYLDMVNNDKPSPTHGANENYAREVLQLFTIGLNQLDASGNVVIDPTTKMPIPTYGQAEIEGFANTFTGWTYAPMAGATSKFTNPPNWNAPMVAFDAHHDTAPKLLLNGQTIANGQGVGVAAKDLHDALANIFNHPNVAPFISRQLIQHLVISNPSPTYVRNVARVFTQSRGDMKAVVKAILLDPEARQGDDPSAAPISGHLREPVLFINAFLRGLGATVAPSNSLTAIGSLLGQQIYYPPTVFNYFAPGYNVNLPGANNMPTPINAPEFQLLSESTAMQRADFANSVAFGKIGGVTVDLTSYVTLLGTKPTTSSMGQMVDALNVVLLDGRMTSDMRSTILDAVMNCATPKAMAQTAVYLIGSSWPYQVER